MMSRFLAFLRTWVLGALLVAAGCALAWHFVAPPPPAVVRIATGPEGSAYREVAEAWAEALGREGVAVALRPTDGAVENLALLRSNDVDLAPVQGGLVLPGRDAALASLGGIFNEPAWVFVRRGAGLRNPMQVGGHMVALGPEGSGTRALALSLLAANGVATGSFAAVPLGGVAAAEALLSGEVDVAFFVASRPGPAISLLLREPERVELVNFATRAAAYAVRLPFLSPVVLPRGGFSLADDLPAQAATLMAAQAFLAAREDINPQLAALLVRVLQATHRGRQLFAAEGSFPTALNQELPVPLAARQAYEHGPSALHQWLPFRWAVAVERLWVFAIPLVTLFLPLLRFAPPVYAWQMRMRVWRGYDQLRRLEREAEGRGDPAARAALLERLAALEAQVSRMGVPAGYAALLYAMRRDIDYVRQRLSNP
jgi:TRAP transporter TAXI family solute receptor